MDEITELSEREIEILKLVATGLSNKEIAYQLRISPNTVKVHLKNIFSKIGVVSRTEAAMFAVRQGWVEAGNQAAVGVIENEGKSGVSGVVQSAFSPFVLSLFGTGGFVLMILVVILFVSLAGRNNPQVIEIVVTPTPEPVRWELVTQMPEAKKSMAYAAVDNRIYIIGGETPNGVSDRVDIYDTVTGQWSEGARKPTSVSEACGAYLDGKIIVAGGKMPDGTVTNVVEAYNVREDRWESLAELPLPLAGAGCVEYEGSYYLIGGWDGEKVIRSVWKYSLSEIAWENAGELIRPRMYFSVAKVDGHIYTIGGLDGVSGLSSVSRLTKKDGVMEDHETSELPEERHHQTSLGVLDKIYVLGGINDSMTLQGSLEISPRDNIQRFIENPKLQTWHSQGIVSFGEYLYSFAGVLDGELSTDFYRLRVLFTLVLPMIRK